MMFDINRRELVKALGAFGGAAAIGSLAAPSRAQGGPIRLGLIAPLSGSQEIVGRYQV